MIHKVKYTVGVDLVMDSRKVTEAQEGDKYPICYAYTVCCSTEHETLSCIIKKYFLTVMVYKSRPF